METESAMRARDSISGPAYHIENYLLEPKYIGLAIDCIMANPPGTTSIQYVKELVRTSKNEAAAEMGKRSLVRKLKSRLNRHLRLNSGSPDQDLSASELRRQLKNCRDAINEEFSIAIDGDELERKLQSQQQKIARLQEQESTPDTLPGRDVLRKIAVRATRNGNYETLRNAILNEMARDEFQPPEMKGVLERSLSSNISVPDLRRSIN